MYTIQDIISGKYQTDGSLSELIENELKKSDDVTILRPGMKNKSHMFKRVDLQGKCFVIDKPIKLRKIDGLIISNGCIVAGPDFPKGKYVFHVVGANTVKFEDLIVDCTKRANGMFFNNFIRVRVEDCTIMHQLNFGIYGNEKGNNHELEVVKCNIMEFVFGDGVPNKSLNEGVIPYFRNADNRQSVGVFLGQADNVIADCNINLCKVGIQVNMRANRIQGNHITAGNTDSNQIYNCIEINKSIKSSCIIVNNYIDNGRVLIRTSAKPIADRNYITITDNLCYRGFNHPKEKEFNHIYIVPEEANSSFSNVLIQSNQFYTQDSNIEGIEERCITPVGIDESNGSISSNRLNGTIMAGNAFTLSDRYKVLPQGTTIVKEVTITKEDKEFEVSFENELPWGEINTFEIISNCNPVSIELSKCAERKLLMKNHSNFKGKIRIKVSSLKQYSGLDYYAE